MKDRKRAICCTFVSFLNSPGLLLHLLGGLPLISTEPAFLFFKSDGEAKSSLYDYSRKAC